MLQRAKHQYSSLSNNKQSNSSQRYIPQHYVSFQSSVYDFLYFFAILVPPLSLFLPLNLIPLTRHFSSVSRFTLTSRWRKCFAWYLSVKRSAGRSAKSHYSPSCSTQEGGNNWGSRGERQGKKTLVLSQTDEWLRCQTQSSWSKLIGCNWLVKYFLMPRPCRIHCSCALFNRCAPIIWKKKAVCDNA